MNNTKALLDHLYKKYHSSQFLSQDPLVCVHRYSENRQIEIVGLLASCLAYGRVERIIVSIKTILSCIDHDPVSFVENTSFAEKKKTLQGFKHRFNSGPDVALLLEAIKYTFNEYGSMGNLIDCIYEKYPHSIKGVMSGFSIKIKEYSGIINRTHQKSFDYLFPSPERGSACKRMNMYFRWMIRKNDGIDFGIWKKIPSSILVMPVDVHIARIARSFGLSFRKSADWKMAEEITQVLKKIDPDDPVKYDFALCRYGMDQYRTQTTKVNNKKRRIT